MKKKLKNKYPAVVPGSVYVIPAPDNRQATIICVAVRSDANGIVLDYFYGPFKVNEMDSTTCCKLHPEGAFFRCFFGDLGIHEGKWPALGHIEKFDYVKWPMTRIFRTDPDENEALEIFMNNELETIEEIECEYDEASNGCEEEYYGYLSAQIKAYKMLESSKVL